MNYLPSKIKSNDFEELQALINVIRDLLDTNIEQISQVFNTLHPANSATVLQFLSTQEREAIIAELGPNFDPEILSYLDDTVLENVLDLWAVSEIAQKIEKLDGQDALKIIEELHKEERRALLRALKPETRVFLEEGLAYAEKTAGRLMKHQVLAIPCEWSVSQTCSFLKTATNLPKDLDEIFIVNRARKPIAKIHIATLMKENGNKSVKEIADQIEMIFPATASEQDILFAFRTYGLKSAPVVDKHEKLIGSISATNVIDMLHTEAQEDFLHSGGLSDSDFYENLLYTSKARLKWLSFSIIGSVGVAMLIDAFSKTIAKKPQLFALLTMIMSISAVAGIQVVTVNIRALINRELSAINFKRTIIKEILVSIINGLILGLFFGIIFGIRDMDIKLCLLLTSSMIISMLYTAVAGTLFPIMFNKLGIDPTLSSGAFLSCTIDAFSTLAFLLIAKAMFL